MKRDFSKEGVFIVSLSLTNTLKCTQYFLINNATQVGLEIILFLFNTFNKKTNKTIKKKGGGEKIFMLFMYLLSLFLEVRSYCLLGLLGDLNICGISEVLEAL